MNYIEFYSSPIAFELFSLQIRWYSIAYLLGILFALGWAIKLSKYSNIKLPENFFDSMITYSILGVIIGGRLGYVIFYFPSMFIDDLPSVLKIWQGGMSFHGGFIGFVIALILYSRKYNINALKLLDLAACGAPFGLFLGRLANFINGELYGKITDVRWAIIFVDTSDGKPRHPSQLYEAFLEGLCLFAIMNYIFSKYKLKPGVIGGLFCIFYSIFRFISEIFREPDEQIGILVLNLSMGQILSLALFIFGLLFAYLVNKRNKNL